MEKELFIFDWDGTLIDSIERIATSLQYAADDVCAIKIPASDARNVIGKGLHDAILLLLPGIDEDTVPDVAESYRDHYLNHNPVQEELFEGAEKLIETLDAAGYRLAIATGKSRQGIARVFDRYPMMRRFDAIQTGCSNPSKPDPTMLLNILCELGISAEDALMIGDSTLDITMAKNAGMDAIAVTSGVHSAEDFAGFDDTPCLEKIADLHDFLHH